MHVLTGRALLAPPLVAIGFAWLGSSTAAVAGADESRCDRSGSRTIVDNESVRVYRLGGSDDNEVFACRIRTGKRTLLGVNTREGYELTNNIRIGGRYVAWANKTCPRYEVGPCKSGFTVLDIRSGKRRGRTTAADILDLELKAASGAVGLISRASPDASPSLDVRKLDAGGYVALDSGAEIEPRSLKLRGSTLSWEHAGQERSATLR